jgi:hypothetical protein
MAKSTTKGRTKRTTKAADYEASLERLRAIISTLPETSEKLSHGAPFFWGGKKTFAAMHSGSYDEAGQSADGTPCPAVWIKADDGVQQALIESASERFYRPKYLGPSGWIAVRVHENSDWGEIEALLIEGYRLVAPKRALRTLDDSNG